MTTNLSLVGQGALGLTGSPGPVGATGSPGSPGAAGTPAKKFRVVQNLVSGNNTITDSLALTTPFARVVDVRLDSNGSSITHRVTAEAANSFTLFVGAAVTNARITVVA